MKIKKSLLSKIIKEEIKLAVYKEKEEPEWSSKVVRFLIKITDDMLTGNFTEDQSRVFKQRIYKTTGMQPEKVLYSLIDKVDPQLLQKAADKLKIKIDSRKLGLTPAVYEKSSPINFTDRRSSKEQPQDPREDPKTGEEKDNWVHEE